MTSKQLRQGYLRKPNESSGKLLQKLYVQALKVWSTSLMQLSCINRTILLFPFLYRHHLAEYLSSTNNSSLSHTEFEKFSLISITTALYSTYLWERTYPRSRALTSVPDHWTTRNRKWPIIVNFVKFVMFVNFGGAFIVTLELTP